MSPGSSNLPFGETQRTGRDDETPFDRNGAEREYRDEAEETDAQAVQLAADGPKGPPAVKV